MVERKKTQGLNDFEGFVENVTIDTSNIKSDSEPVTQQYHLEIKALNIEVSGKTGLVHEWIRISPETTETEIAEDSILDKYLRQMELLDKAVKKAETHIQAMQWLKGKKFQFKKMILGKAYKGHDAREYIIPVKVL